MAEVAEIKLSVNRWQVLQPAIYLISLLPGLFLLSLLPDGGSKPFLALTTLAVVLIQHGINVLNDSIDWRKGADSEKELSWVRFHSGDLKWVNAHGIMSFMLGVTLGSAVVIATQAFDVFYVAFPLLALGYGYNASQWTLSYTSLGEWVTGLCYGPGVFGCMGYLFLKTISVPLMVGSLAFGCLAVAVLFSHQPPQVFSDFLAGKSTFAVRYGKERTIRTAKILAGVSLLLLTAILTLRITAWPMKSTLLITGALLQFQNWRNIPNPGRILKAASILIFAGTILVWGESLL